MQRRLPRFVAKSVFPTQIFAVKLIGETSILDAAQTGLDTRFTLEE